jgi:hypothetical protein
MFFVVTGKLDFVGSFLGLFEGRGYKEVTIFEALTQRSFDPSWFWNI